MYWILRYNNSVDDVNRCRTVFSYLSLLVNSWVRIGSLVDACIVGGTKMTLNLSLNQTVVGRDVEDACAPGRTEPCKNVPAMPPVVRGQGCLKGSDCWCRRLFQSQPRRWWGQECAPPTFPSDIPAAASTPLARSATGPRRVSCRADSPILGERLRGPGSGTAEKEEKGFGWMNGSLKLPFISFRD